MVGIAVAMMVASTADMKIAVQAAISTHRRRAGERGGTWSDDAGELNQGLRRRRSQGWREFGAESRADGRTRQGGQHGVAKSTGAASANGMAALRRRRALRRMFTPIGIA
jgi:hypothetical protein